MTLLNVNVNVNDNDNVNDNAGVDFPSHTGAPLRPTVGDKRVARAKPDIGQEKNLELQKRARLELITTHLRSGSAKLNGHGLRKWAVILEPPRISGCPPEVG